MKKKLVEEKWPLTSRSKVVCQIQVPVLSMVGGISSRSALMNCGFCRVLAAETELDESETQFDGVVGETPPMRLIRSPDASQSVIVGDGVGVR